MKMVESPHLADEVTVGDDVWVEAGFIAIRRRRHQ